MKEVEPLLKVSEQDIAKRIKLNIKQIKELEKEISRLKNQISGESMQDYIAKVKEIGGVKYLTTEISGFHAGNKMKEITKIGSGSGGGRPDMAQGGIKDKDKIGEIIEAIPEVSKIWNE